MIRSFLAAFILSMVSLLPFISCDKKFENFKVPELPSHENKKPVANAGPDIIIGQATCTSLRYTSLVGSQSYDPDSNNITYHWTKISGPEHGVLSDNGNDTAIYLNISSGLYAFELKVTNSNGLSARDTMIVDATNWTLPEYDLDISFTGTYVFYDNRADCSDTPCFYEDWTVINATGSFASFGEFKLKGNEITDTAYATTHVNSRNIRIETTGEYPQYKRFIAGPCSVFFKELIQNGGGPFTGTVTITGGSASDCVPGIYSNLIPLTIVGSLDTITHVLNINIKGKAIF